MKTISKRKRVPTIIEGESKTQQHMRDQCDVNKILEKYQKTGMMSHTRNSPGEYGDFSRFQDFKSNLEIVMTAQTQFDSLPAQLRKRFGNDPAHLIDFLEDQSNYDEALKLGLLSPPDQPKEPKNDKTINPAPPIDQAPKA